MSTMQITNDGLNLFRDGSSGANTPTITYFAIGTGSSTPTASQHALDAEVFRKAITSYTNGANGEVLVNGVLSAGDAVGVVIGEVAFFGGSTAGATANSGVMVARGQYSHTKLSSESLQFQLDLVF